MAAIERGPDRGGCAHARGRLLPSLLPAGHDRPQASGLGALTVLRRPCAVRADRQRRPWAPGDRARVAQRPGSGPHVTPRLPPPAARGRPGRTRPAARLQGELAPAHDRRDRSVLPELAAVLDAGLRLQARRAELAGAPLALPAVWCRSRSGRERRNQHRARGRAPTRRYPEERGKKRAWRGCVRVWGVGLGRPADLEEARTRPSRCPPAAFRGGAGWIRQSHGRRMRLRCPPPMAHGNSPCGSRPPARQRRSGSY